MQPPKYCKLLLLAALSFSMTSSLSDTRDLATLALKSVVETVSLMVDAEMMLTFCRSDLRSPTGVDVFFSCASLCVSPVTL